MRRAPFRLSLIGDYTANYKTSDLISENLGNKPFFNHEVFQNQILYIPRVVSMRFQLGKITLRF